MNNGAQAEFLAAEFLQCQGLQLLTRNFHCRFGEIDLIMQDKDTLVFVEVRLRSSSNYGGAVASIDRHKQLRLIRTAQYYLSGLAHSPPPCRFDVIAMDDANGLDLQWVKNAFEA